MGTALTLEEAVSLYEDAPCGYATLAVDGTILRSNRTLAGWMGLGTSGALEGRSFQDLLTAPSKLLYGTYYSSLLQVQGSVGDLALELSREGKPSLPVMITSRIIMDGDSRPSYISSTLFDITERRRYEHELLAAKRQADTLADVVRFSDTAILTASFDLQIETWNAAARHLLGEPLATARFLYDLLPGPCLEQFIRSLETASPVIFEQPVHPGTICRITAYPLTDGIAIFLLDITQELASQKALHENEALRRRAEEEAAASKAKTEFLSNMSHEIRTPMNGVLGMLQLLATTELSPEQQNYTSIARSSGEVLTSLLDEILDLSKIEAGRTVLELVDFSLQRLLTDVVDMWSIQARAKGLMFRCRFDLPMPTLLRADPTRLRQILNNLISNAIKFTATGGVTLTAEVGCCIDVDPWLRFSVIDTGIGLQPDQAELIFEPFTQADSSTTRRFGGTGLGLAICKRLVDLMGGTMAVESRAGEGAVFLLKLPYTPAEEKVLETENVPNAPSRQPTVASMKGSPPWQPHRDGYQPTRILVVEDNPTNQLVVLAQLKKLGYCADLATNGLEAVEAVQRANYQIILMDCEMPVMDGFNATRQIRSLGYSAVQIIALTAHAMSDNKHNCFEAGMDFFLSKPIKLDYLARILEERSARSSSERQPQPPTVVAPTEEREACFAPDSLLDRLMGDRELATFLLRSFLADCPSQLDNLRFQTSASNGPEVRRLAHSLRGAAATVSAQQLSAIAKNIEAAADKEPATAWPPLLVLAEQALEQFTNTLKDSGWLSSTV